MQEKNQREECVLLSLDKVEGGAKSGHFRHFTESGSVPLPQGDYLFPYTYNNNHDFYTMHYNVLEPSAPIGGANTRFECFSTFPTPSVLTLSANNTLAARLGVGLAGLSSPNLALGF